MFKSGPSGMDTRRSSPARVLELELEPLSEQRWSKIEHGVFARLDAGELPDARSLAVPARFSARRAGGWALGLAAAVLMAVLALGVPFRSAAPSVSRISTGVTASHVALPGVVLDVSPESAVVVSGNSDESAFIAVDRGEVTCDVAHRRPGAPLIVQAGEVSVVVVGTRFSVARKDDAAIVKVHEGAVRVKFRGQTAMVKAGETWPPPRAAVASPDLALDLPDPPSESPDTASSADVSARPAHAREATPKQAREAQKKRSGVTSSSGSTEASPPSFQSQFELATGLEAKDPIEAIRLYEGLEGSSGTWAANALFAHGRLEAARGNRVAARRILTQYLTRFPREANAPDARLLLTRLE
jgi:FecR protein